MVVPEVGTVEADAEASYFHLNASLHHFGNRFLFRPHNLC